MFRRILIGSILTLVTSFYVFPVTFTFLPESVNSKMLVAVFGIAMYVYDCIRKKSMELSRPTLVAMLMAILFSLWCLFCVTLAGTYDLTYATYIVSFLTWIAGAYGVYAALRIGYGEVDIWLMVRFLALVGVFQCVSAVLIDNNVAFSQFVDRFVSGNEYYREHKRIYGIGAALDPAGIRFSVILVMMAHQFSADPSIRSNGNFQTNIMIAYAVILIIGSTISRTTVVGGAMGIAYMILTLIRLRQGGFVTIRMVRGFFIFFLVLTIILVASVYFYRTSRTFEGYLRFGFEAFFNWAETGEFRTHSTDELSEMWVWPSDMRTWFIGRGTFGVFANDTDIGYCNFIFYSGLVGMFLFSLYFLYVHLVLNRKFRHFGLASFLLVSLTFIIWLKVTTDIFFIDALLFCVAADEEEALEEATWQEMEAQA